MKFRDSEEGVIFCSRNGVGFTKVVLLDGTEGFDLLLIFLLLTLAWN